MFHPGLHAISRPHRDRPPGAAPTHRALRDAGHNRLIAQAIGLTQ